MGAASRDGGAALPRPPVTVMRNLCRPDPLWLHEHREEACGSRVCARTDRRRGRGLACRACACGCLADSDDDRRLEESRSGGSGRHDHGQGVGSALLAPGYCPAVRRADVDRRATRSRAGHQLRGHPRRRDGLRLADGSQLRLDDPHILCRDACPDRRIRRHRSAQHRAARSSSMSSRQCRTPPSGRRSIPRSTASRSRSRLPCRAPVRRPPAACSSRSTAPTREQRSRSTAAAMRRSSPRTCGRKPFGERGLHEQQPGRPELERRPHSTGPCSCRRSSSRPTRARRSSRPLTRRSSARASRSRPTSRSTPPAAARRPARSSSRTTASIWVRRCRSTAPATPRSVRPRCLSARIRSRPRTRATAQNFNGSSTTLDQTVDARPHDARLYRRHDSRLPRSGDVVSAARADRQRCTGSGQGDRV